MAIAALSGCPDIPDRDAPERPSRDALPGPDDPNDVTLPSASDDPGSSVPDAPSRVPPDPRPPSLAEVHAQVLRPDCGACHIDRSPPAGNLFLRQDAQLADRLLAPSTQAPHLSLVQPGDPLASYLFLKVDGTHVDAGGRGERCPVGGDALPPTSRDLLWDWIDSQSDPDRLR